LYVYCTCDPIGFVDPSGLFTIEPVGRPVWKQGNGEHDCLDGVWMSVVLFATGSEKAAISKSSGGMGTIVQRKHARWLVKDCCGRILPEHRGIETATFYDFFSVSDGEVSSPGYAIGMTFVTGEWMDNEWIENGRRVSLDYVALIHKIFSTEKCTSGYIDVTAQFLLYNGMAIVSGPGEGAGGPPGISWPEYEHDHESWWSGWTPVGPLDEGEDLELLANGYLKVRIDWDCDGGASISIESDAENPYDTPSTGINARIGREEDTRPRSGWVAF